MITVVTGNFGSGKTEIAINLALQNKSTLIDLDLVNPYFRSRKVTEQLEKKGIRVIMPPQELAYSDLPIVTPQVLGELQKDNPNVVIDVGGDNIGAVVLGRFNKLLSEKDANIFFVINPYRPLTGELTGVVKMLEEIERAARLKIKNIISNPNLGRSTTVADIIEGHKKVEETAQFLNKKIKFLTCQKMFVNEVKNVIKEPILGLDIFMLTPWEEYNGGVISEKSSF